ncbi:hypothetical protein H8959_007164 [Pygathrix nigripes]
MGHRSKASFGEGRAASSSPPLEEEMAHEKPEGEQVKSPWEEAPSPIPAEQEEVAGTPDWELQEQHFLPPSRITTVDCLWKGQGGPGRPSD